MLFPAPGLLRYNPHTKTSKTGKGRHSMIDNVPNSGYFRTFDGAQMFERRWEPDGTPRAHLALVHGFGEHCSRYDHVGRAMSAAGIAVHAFDQRGFGRSPGRRAYIAEYEPLLRDLDAFLELVRGRAGDLPLFIMGHSMGGQVIALHYLTRKPPVAGIVFSSAFLQFADDVPKALVALSGIVGTLLPWLPVSKVETIDISRDPEVVRAADADPLSFHGRVLARTGAQFKFAIDHIQARLEEFDKPMYVLHGTDDKLIPVRSSRELYARAGSADKTLKIYEGGYHELWNDLCKDEAIQGIIDWLTARC